MKSQHKIIIKSFGKRIRQIGLLATVLPLMAYAATVDLTTVPLATATNTSVKPNVMFVLDNSGSMDWDYMPDWVMSDQSTGTTYYCKNSTAGTASTQCQAPRPPFYAAAFNGAYYDPTTWYEPPKDHNGNVIADYDGNTAVPYDGYGVQSGSTLNLKTNYPDEAWCTNAAYTDCLRNDNYVLPKTIGGKNYTTRHTTTASGTAKFATGTVAAPTATATATAVGPHYYVVVPGEYCTNEKLTNCTTASAPTGLYIHAAKLRWCSNTNLTTCQAIRTTTYKYPRYPTLVASSGGAVTPGSYKRFDIVSTSAPFTNYIVSGEVIVDRKNRKDCDEVTPSAGNNFSSRECTYAQELRNFANWFAWYRTRMQMMKSSVSLAFQTIDNRYRVGYYTINNPSSNYLKVDTFTAGNGEQKNLWFNKLRAADPGSGTPLRSALANVGRIFAGKNPLGVSGGDDPVQYSCQQNFTILTTDGYWNTDGASNIKTVTGANLGNMDGGSTPRPYYEGASPSSGSLADVAKYYYDTDLRNASFNNCIGSLGEDVCENNVFVSTTDNNVQQHMTTFTLGLGIDGTLQYQKDYKTATEGDYYNIRTGSASANWPVPAQNTATAIDDLWHAAVNGRGTYFSARNAGELADGLNEALSSIGVRVGAGAAAATSSLNPVAGNNFAYIASYTTVKWQGNLEARTVDYNTGEISDSANWCVEDVYASTCASPSIVVSETSGGSTTNYCVTPSVPNVAACPTGIYDSTAQTCKIQIAATCTGSLKFKVAAGSDTRKIILGKRDTGGTGPNGLSFSLVDFYYDNLTPAQKIYFSNSVLSAMSQWGDLTAAQQTAAAGENLLGYVRGRTGYEERSANLEENRLYRYREAVMGDAMESQPVYVGKPQFKYTDDYYTDFIVNNTNRAGTVYIGTNDGMLHAFNASTGEERWAYVPSMVLGNLWKLADKKYANKHENYVNGSPIVADVYDKVAGVWKTILVSGLNGGGRGYFALDITDPDPTKVRLLWEIDSSMEPDIGYTYGTPMVTKKADGTWVVVFTSGYNNTSDGEGHVFVRDAITGVALDKISNNVGTSTTPSGLAKISGWVHNAMADNSVKYIYGGDLLGNVWRFNINGTSAADKLLKFAELKDSAGDPQPVTTAPEMASLNNSSLPVIIIATGKYLEQSDLSNTQLHTLYAISDNDVTASLYNPRTSGKLVQQTVTPSGSTGTRTGSANPVDWDTGRGWFVDFPESGERAHVSPKFDFDMVIAPTTVPSTDAVCSPGGHGWLNYFNLKTGSMGEDAVVSQKFDGPIVGINVYYTVDGKRRVAVVTSNNPKPRLPTDQSGLSGSGGAGEFRGTRAIWREIIQ